MKWLGIFLLLVLAGCTPEFEQIVVGHDIAPDASCKWTADFLPDPRCSPGHAFPLDTIQVNGKYALEPGKVIVGDICVPGYTANVRDVSQKLKERVYENYGVRSRKTGEYEMDHIIPLTIGGDNDIRNLYPQPAVPKPGYKEKDRVEVWLNKQVCSGQMSLLDAQELVAKNWTKAWVMMND